MLDLDLDLEADLGVDTVKQAEMFAAVRELYKIPRDENRKLRDYPTLAQVIRFVYEKRPDLAAEQPATKADRTGPSLRRLHRMRSKRKYWKSLPKRPATRKTCWTWISTWKRISAWTP